MRVGLQQRRGATLLIAIGVLTLLSLFALTFSRLMNFERRASAYYTDSVRARMASRAGVHRAIRELQRIVSGPTGTHYSNPWSGENAFGRTGGNWGYRDFKRTPGNLGLRGLDALTTMTPSFPTVDPQGRDFLGDPLVYSGDLGQPYGATSILCYKLRILDTAGQLNLNHPDREAARRMLESFLRAEFDPGRHASTRDGIHSTRRTLNPGYEAQVTLNGTQAGQVANIMLYGVPNPASVNANYLREPNSLVGGRPSRGFQTKPEIKASLFAAFLELGIVGDIDAFELYWERMKNKLTVHGWEDPGVIRPPFLNGVIEHRVPLMPRAAVNVNTASYAVLVSLFAGLTAENDLGTFTIGYESATRIARAILSYRRTPPEGPTAAAYYNFPTGGTVTNTDIYPQLTGTQARNQGFRPFRSWVEFERFVDNLPVGHFADSVWSGDASAGAKTQFVAQFYTQILTNKTSDAANGVRIVAGFRDLVKAQLNPNTMVNKFGHMPNHGGWLGRLPRTVDKTDITSMTTEGCFDSMGVFEITSVGLILNDEDKVDAAGNDLGLSVVAAQTQVAIVEVYKPFRLSTQQDFEKHRGLQIAGNFIPAQDAVGGASPTFNYFSQGHNKAVYYDNYPEGGADVEPTRGWPGVLSWPAYSLDRQHDSARATERNPKPQYQLASWDGHLALTNLIGVKTADSDFICGFARGRLEAFKNRVWWPVKYEHPSALLHNWVDPQQDLYGLDPDNTTGGVSGVSPGTLGLSAPLNFDLTTSDDANFAQTNFPTYLDPATYPFNYGNFAYNRDGGSAGTVNNTFTDRVPRLYAISLEEQAAVLDEDPTNPASARNAASLNASQRAAEQRARAMFFNGSSLLNTGVVIAPDRVSGGWDGTGSLVNENGRQVPNRNPRIRSDGSTSPGSPLGNPQFLAFDGNNLDLNRTTSVRFWIQPMIDPFSRGTEVLLSFMGSINGKDRQAGFRITKEVQGNTVKIVLWSEDPFDPEAPEDYCAYAGTKRTVDWGWGAQQTVEIDVTPRMGSGVGYSDPPQQDGLPTLQTNVVYSANSPGVADDTYVVNITSPYSGDPFRDDPSASAGDPDGGPKWIPGRWHFIAVDLGMGRKISDPSRRSYFGRLRVDGVQSNALDFRNDDYNGAAGGSSFALSDIGELYGYAVPTEGRAGFRNDRLPKSQGQGGVVQRNTFGGGFPVGGGGGGGGTHYRVGSDREPLNPVNSNTSSARGWLRPRRLGDFYHCQADKVGNGVISVYRETVYGGVGEHAFIWQGSSWPYFNWVNGGPAPGTYILNPAVMEQHSLFPARSYDRTMLIRCLDGNGNEVTNEPLRVNKNNFTWRFDPPLGSSGFGPDEFYGHHPAAQQDEDGNLFQNNPNGWPADYGSGSRTRTGYNPRSNEGYPDTSGTPPLEWWKQVVVGWREDHYIYGSPHAILTPADLAQGAYPADGSNLVDRIRASINRTLLSNVTSKVPDNSTDDVGGNFTRQATSTQPSSYPLIESLEDPRAVPFNIDNSGNPIPGEPPLEPMHGEGMHYATHNSGTSSKHAFTIGTGIAGSDVGTWVRTKQPLPVSTGSSFFPSLNVPNNILPLTYIDDDCKGCEDCDVDGPVFIGGEPAGLVNYESDGTVANVDPYTMAYAVFDNITFINGDEARRTDFPGAPDRPGADTTNTPLANPQVLDRFFESNLIESLGTADDFGAVYHRGLLELIDEQADLGTVTWTSYPAVPTTDVTNLNAYMDFEVGLWVVENDADGAGRRRWRPANGNVVPDPSNPNLAPYFNSPADGIRLYDEGNDRPTFYDGVGATTASAAPQLLVLGVRLDPDNAPTAGGVRQPQIDPLRQSPVFEDITLIIVPRGARIRYSEEGAEE